MSLWTDIFGGNNTTTTTQTPNPQAMAAYQAILAKAAAVGNQPYVPYTGELVAGINPQQYMGIGNINQYAGWAMPYFQQAGALGLGASQPLTQGQIQNYESPYTQSVVDATTNWLNQQNKIGLENVKGNAIAQGALGGDREALAEGAYMGSVMPGETQQIAGLYNQGYTQAAQMAAQQYQQNPMYAASLLGSLGAGGQNAALTGAGAQFGVGTSEQQTQQQLDAALMQQYMWNNYYQPQQQAQWQAGIDTGVGSQMGGTSTTVGPPPSPFSQIAGLGMAGIGLANTAGNLGWKPFGTAADGGRIEGRDAGGAAPGLGYPYNQDFYGVSSNGLMPGHTMPSGAKAPTPQDPLGKAKELLGLAGLGGQGHGQKTAPAGAPISLSPPPFTTYGGGGVGDQGPTLAMAGLPPGVMPTPLVDTAGDLDALHYRGGGVHGYDDGGGVDDEGDPLDAYASAAPEGVSGDFERWTASRRPSGTGLLGISNEYNMPLITAGLSMMAGRSPYPLQNIGQGALAGVGAYQKEQKQEFDQAKAVEDLNKKAKLAQATLNYRTQMLNESKRFHDIEANQWKPMTDPFGNMKLYNARTGEWKDAPTSGPTSQNNFVVPGQPTKTTAEDDGIIPANARLVQGGAYDYHLDAPYIEKGMDVPDPQAYGGKSVQALKQDAEYYLETGRLPVVSRGNNPNAIMQQNYRNAVQNYAIARANSIGFTPEELSIAWRQAPGMTSFIKSAAGNATVSLGVAMRHLATLQEYADAWNAPDSPDKVQALNRLRAVVSREFGGTAATNLDTVAHIVGPEIIKAIGIAGGGTERDREGAVSQFSTARGNDQVRGAIDATKKLLTGQLEGKHNQATASGVPEVVFKRLIGEKEYGQLMSIDAAATPQTGAPVKVGSPAEATKLAPGTRYVTPDGKVFTR
jgi:hypothetical protein